MSVQSTMRRKVGPLPVYAYVAIATAIVVGLYLRHRSAGSAASSATATDTAGTTGTGAGTLDPTSGLPYAGAAGSGSDLTGVGATPDGTSVPIGTEISDVASLRDDLASLGFLTTGTPSESPVVDESGVIAAIQGLQAAMQAASDHEPPPTVGERATTQPVVYRKSAAHNGQLWAFHVGSDGKTLIPVGAAPAGVKATTDAALAHAKASVTPAQSVAKPPPSPQRKIVQKPSASHNGAMWDYEVAASGKLIPLHPVKGK